MIPLIPARSRRAPKALAATALVSLALVGCTAEQKRGFLPQSTSEEVANQTGRIIAMWTGSWMRLVAVGLLVWGLVFWCAIAYRRKKSDKGFPIQLRYHVPLELTFTLIPIVLIMTLFYFTQRDITEIERLDAKPEQTINVVAKQWAWDFNYVDQNVHEPAGVQSFRTGEEGAEQDLPVLWVPVNTTVEFQLDSRDVVHSFWVVDFLYKKDIFPGHTTVFQVTPTAEGEFPAKCAELCGEYHSDMLFTLKVVSQEEFDAHMEELRAQGYEGQLDNSLNRMQESWDMQDKNDETIKNRREEGAK